MEILGYVLLLVVWCVLFAKLEAEIEGANGWAAALPTKRYRKTVTGEVLFREFAKGDSDWKYLKQDSFKAKFMSVYINFLGDKDFTIYHRVVDLIQLFVSHLLVYLFFKGMDPWWALELRAFAGMMVIWSVEDTLWFYINPEAHKSEHHKSWLMIGQKRIMEKGMVGNLLGGIALITISFFLNHVCLIIF